MGHSSQPFWKFNISIDHGNLFRISVVNVTRIGITQVRSAIALSRLHAAQHCAAKPGALSNRARSPCRTTKDPTSKLTLLKHDRL